MIGGIFAWISRDDMQAAAIGAGVLAASLTAVVALFRQPVVNRPIRWFGRKLGIIGRILIGDPLTKVVRQALDAWADERIHPSIAALSADLAEVKTQIVFNNGGSSNRDQLDAIGEQVGLPPRPKVYPPPEDAE